MRHYKILKSHEPRCFLPKKILLQNFKNRQNEKGQNITTIIFLFEGVLTALTSQTDAAKQRVSDLGYSL